MSLDLFNLWAQMGNFAKGIVVVMAIMSIYSLTIVITKLVQLKKSERATRKFAPQFSRAIQEENLDQAITLAEKNKKSHVSRVLGEALAEAQLAASRGERPIAAVAVAFAGRPLTPRFTVPANPFTPPTVTGAPKVNTTR